MQAPFSESPTIMTEPSASLPEAIQDPLPKERFEAVHLYSTGGLLKLFCYHVPTRELPQQKGQDSLRHNNGIQQKQNNMPPEKDGRQASLALANALVR